MRPALVLPALLLGACAGCRPTVYEDTDSDPPPDDVADDALWQAVADRMDASAADAPETGMTLVVWDRAGDVVFRHTVGGFEPDVRVPVASSSKLVTALTLLRLVHEGELELTSTTGEVLGWTGDHAPITLDMTGAFVTGLPGSSFCQNRVNIELAACVEELADTPLLAPPGTRFEYGNTHMATAARMAEVRTDLAWNDVFATRLAAPLGLDDPDLLYVTRPKSGEGTTNPLVAGGLRATVDEYGHFVRLVLNEGQVDGQTLIDAALIDRLFRNPYNSATVGSSPYQDQDIDFRYGFGTWLECPGPAASCEVVSSAGSFGWTPWVDRSRGYGAILAMEGSAGEAGRFAVPLQQELRPLIEAAWD